VKQILAAASSGAYKLGFGACLVHLVVSWWIIIGIIFSARDAQWQLIWIFLLPFDFPFSLLVLFGGYIFPDWSFRGLPSPWDDFHGFFLPVVVHGIIGPLWYFLLPVLIDGVMSTYSSRSRIS
jgi:hypothetical protein